MMFLFLSFSLLLNFFFQVAKSGIIDFNMFPPTVTNEEISQK
jgi:hypothetical protein